LTPLRGRLTGG